MNEQLKGTSIGEPIPGDITESLLQRQEKVALEEYRSNMQFRNVKEREMRDDFL